MFRSTRDVTYIKRNECKTEGQEKGKKSDLFKYKCNFCTDGYMSESEVEIHRKIVHKKEINKLVQDTRKSVCKICITELKDDESLVRHIKTEHLLSSPNAQRVEREIFICDFCHQLFFNKLLLSVHIIHNHMTANKVKTYVECPKCHKTVRLLAVWSHFQAHLIQSVACCPICLTKCKDRKDLSVHLRTHQYHYICDMCGYQTKKESYFNQHVQQHIKNKIGTQSEEKDATVRKCFIPGPNLLPWKYQYQYGLRGLILPNKVHICVLCREICVDINRMRQHILEDHSPKSEPKKKSHLCSCGEEFFNSVLLKHHIFKLQGDHRIVEDHNIKMESSQIETGQS